MVRREDTNMGRVYPTLIQCCGHIPAVGICRNAKIPSGGMDLCAESSQGYGPQI
jgi:hypothetical protein